ncbi:C-C motif chemokine 16-like [Gambusia affinis]|uniref:C-C motif chemokine 16-like n=1 Tax=Gambusia affinis TaxID=33528 RepID=UPI001CDD7973|nr:C-C motif chemokine 16-like [Gambusia affinis]XP_043961149.1 C-C motif chemokine 16-like [Gambusia affinis]
MFLAIVAVWIVFSASAGSSFAAKCFVCPPCCIEGSEKADLENFECFEQKAGNACHKHFFLIISANGLPLCIKPNSQWLQQKIKNENLKCLPTDAMQHKNHKSEKFLKKQNY